jgi:hypothetical protein
MDEEIDPFLMLTSFEPGEWPNIPRPLLLLVICMQRCISVTRDRVEEVAGKCFQAVEENRKKVRDVECFLPIVKNSVSSLEAEFIEKVENVKFKAADDLNVFKIGLGKDLDFKQKSTDGKIHSVQEQLFALKKTVNTLPFLQEIENLINNSCISLRKSLKKEIHDYMFSPEISSINTKIRETKEYFDNSLIRIQEMMAVYGTSIKVLNEQFNEKFVSFERFLNNCDKEFRDLAVKSDSHITDLSKELEGLELKLDNKQAKVFTGFKTFQEKLAEVEQANKGNFNEIKVLKKKIDLSLKETLKIVEAVNLIQSENKNNLILKNQKKEKKLAELQKKREEGKFEEELGEEKSGKNYCDEIGEGVEGVEEVSRSEKQKNENIGEMKVDHHKLRIKIASPPPDQTAGDSTLSQTPAANLKPLDLAPSLLSSSFFSNASASFSENTPKDTPDLSHQLKQIDSKLSETQEKFFKLQEKIDSERLETSFLLKEITEKFQWFPMTLTEIKGKSPSEARLYTLEARLRNEENTRVDQFNHLLTTINHLKFDYFCSDQFSQTFKSPKRQGTGKTVEKRTSRESLQSFDQVRKPENRIKLEMQSEQFKARRMSLNSERASRNLMFKVPHLS